jgi:hypothetical protein
VVAIVANTRAMKSSGTASWNRSDIELTKMRRGFRHRNGSSSLSGCSVTVANEPLPLNRSCNVSA